MSSDTTRADKLIERLETVLGDALPEGWRVQDAEGQTTTTLSMVLYYEQGNVRNEVPPANLPAGYLGVDFTLTVAAPEKDPVKGTRSATEGLLVVLPILDGLADIFWGPEAQKERLTTGETVYRIPITFLSNYITTEE